MNLNDGPLLMLASTSLFGWGVALGLWFERNKPNGTIDLREQRDKARNLAKQLRGAKAPQHPAYSAGHHLDADTAAAVNRGQLRVGEDDVS